ncbi:hypothetical protein [Chitinilyticum piscinae]|uniref:DUF2141 domain-containing protein n=1 Tax=Chitinilyticum piscinae TaxID=2866724 RepID=A0A8J7FN20_9NEIS|nr:hypothetical protein [Chitinilyticum piscinae]MBE9609179.1 hypothetical protein [Chitinilyticum piscinae]
MIRLAALGLSLGALLASVSAWACEDLKVRARPGLSVNVDHVRHGDLLTVFLSVQQFGKTPASFAGDAISITDQHGQRYYPLERRGALHGPLAPSAAAQKAELIFDLKGDSLAQTLELR